jgi:hypothetical protein
VIGFVRFYFGVIPAKAGIQGKVPGGLINNFGFQPEFIPHGDAGLE